MARYGIARMTARQALGVLTPRAWRAVMRAIP